MALLVESLTGGLAGFGRADPKEGWGATVMVQVLDLEAFGSRAQFERQMEAIAAACRANPPRAGFDRVRLPGERGLARRGEQLRDGIALNPEIMPALEPWARRFGLTLPVGA
jgi:L-lactate dehydrogenase